MNPFPTTTVAGLTYAGVDVLDWDVGVFLDLVVGLVEIPAVRGEDTTVPGAGGRVAGNRVNDVLALELRGCVRDGSGGYIANLLAVRALFASDRARADLVATLRDGTELTISALPMSIANAEQIPGSYAELSITLEGYDDWVVTGS